MRTSLAVLRHGRRASNQLYEFLDICVQVLPGCSRTTAFRLELGSLELYLQRVHEAVHQAPKCGDCRQLDDFGAVEVLR